MNKAFKGGNALWISASIISLLSAAVILFLMLQERNKRIETEDKLLKTEKARRSAEIKLDHTQLELAQIKNQNQILGQQLLQEKNNYQATLAEVDKRDTEIRKLENSLASEKKQSTSLANAIAQLRENYNILEEKSKQSQLQLEQFQQPDRSSTKAKVELEKIVVKPKKKLTGKILVVNTEFHFVVIDLGRKDDLSVGDEFIVYQGAQDIGKVRVEKIYDTMSSAAILPGSQEHDIVEDAIVKSF